jgi:multidrug efflux pump subunit AcrA (membrane-fusion protein)
MVRILTIFMAVFICFWGEAKAASSLVVKKAYKEITLTGYTRSKTTQVVSSEVPGRVLRVNYDVGQKIEDRPFIEIDPVFIDFQIESTQRSITKITIALKKGESNLSYLRKEFARLETLYKSDRIAAVKRDAAEESMDQAAFELDAIAVEKALLETKLKELRERKARHRIFAPQGWIVVEKNVEPGEMIASGAPLAKVADYRQLVIPLYVSTEELAAIKALAHPMQARLEETPVMAKIEWINPEFDEKTRKLSLELILIGYEGEKRGGLSFVLPLEISIPGLLVPKAAVVNRYENPKVKVKATGEVIDVLVLGENDGALIIAADGRLPVGTQLAEK